MSRPSKFGFRGLRKDHRGYYVDHYFMEGGKKKRKREWLGHITLPEAKRIMEKKMPTISRPGSRITFAEAADGFLAFSEVRKKSHHQDLIYVKRLKAFFGMMPVESLNLDEVEKFLANHKKRREEAGEPPLKGSSLNRYLACLKTIVRRAFLNGHIDRNPIQGIRLFKETPRDTTITQEEFQNLLDQCLPHMKPVVELAYYTCMRKGEILGLEWPQIDFKNKILTLEASDTKTEEKREIPLDDTLLAIFKSIPRTLGTNQVFTYQGRAITEIRTGFASACRKAGIKGLHFHDLRRCAITNMRKAGVPESVIMSISGHKTQAVFRRYNRIDREDRRQALEKVRDWSKDTHKTVNSIRAV